MRAMTAGQPWRLLILDRDPEDPRWLLATVNLASDVRPADLDAAGRYQGWAEAAAWVTSVTGAPVCLVPVRGALAWSVDEGTAPRD
jgi:hypothetical protein